MKNKILLLLSMLFFFLVFVFPFVSANVITVPGNFLTIQAAINNASTEDIIIVSAGTYNESLIINKSLTLLGVQNGVDAKTRSTSNESIINSSLFYYGTIQIQSDNVKIDGFKIINSYKAIHVTEDSSNVTVINNIILGPMYDGINLWRASSAYVENNFVSGANTSGITAGDDRGTFDKSDDLITKATIKNNLVENSRYGITGYQKNSIIEGNVVREYSIGEGAGIGGQFMGADIENNLIEGYSYGAGFALEIYPNRSNSSHIQFENNRLTNNHIGVYVNQIINGQSVNFSHNKIFNNFIGAGNTNTNSSEMLNAEYNYWGSCESPTVGNNTSIRTDIIGYVDYTPWLGICSKNETSLPLCSVENQDIKLYSNLSGVCINGVIFSAKLNGVWTNFTGSPSIAPEDIKIGNYYVLINSNFTNSENVEWKVYTKDCYNNAYNDSSQSFYINPSTTLTMTPLEPNGKNGWYITNPIFNLTNPDASRIYYKWDNSGETFAYSTSTFFGFENAPNNQNITGGIIDLNYWSQLSCGNEPVQSKIIKVDLTAPEIKDITPTNNSLIHETNPKIYAYLKDNGNSGINISSLIFKLNGNIITNPNTTNKSFNYEIEYSPSSELSNGQHNVSINVSDYAGRNTEVLWRFNVEKINNSFDLKVYSLFNEIYPSMKIQLNFTATKNVNFIEYIDRGTLGSNRWIKLCYNCNNYGFSVLKYATFPDGQHNLTIRTSNEFETHEKNISFIVDSKAPQIQKTEPKANQFTNGSNFYIRFSEDNPSELALFLNNSLDKYIINLSKCTKAGKYTDCYYNIDDIELTPFEGQTIPYWFELKDIANHTSSTRKTLVKVDTQNPRMDVISPQEDTTYAKTVPFSISVDEKSLNSVSYTYTSNGKEKEVLLCSKLDKKNICKITKSFTSGNYTIIVKAEDKAGNVAGIPITFEVK